MMNTLLYIYFKLPHDKTLGIVTKAVNRLLAKIIKRILDKTLPAYFLKTQSEFPSCLNTENRDKKVIISFTSFPKRIVDVWIVVECILRQSHKADRIILWLSKEQFQGFELPESLLNQQLRGLEIKFVNEDLKSHKKYLYAFSEFPNDYVVTIDDDLYYDKDFLKNLVEIKMNHPDAVATNRAHKFKFNSVGQLSSYSQWYHNITDNIPSYMNIQTGGFGTLYELSDMHHSYNDIELIKQLIPYADDLWVKVQTLLTNKKVVTNARYNKDPITVKNSQLEKLVSKNVLEGGNDVQLHKVLHHFGLGNLEEFKDV